jgi:hypothetical protein
VPLGDIYTARRGHQNEEIFWGYQFCILKFSDTRIHAAPSYRRIDVFAFLIVRHTILAETSPKWSLQFALCNMFSNLFSLSTSQEQSQ